MAVVHINIINYIVLGGMLKKYIIIKSMDQDHKRDCGHSFLCYYYSPKADGIGSAVAQW